MPHVAPREGRSRGRQARIPANLQPATSQPAETRVVWESLDSLAQSCGLSLPTFNQRGWFMTSSICAAPSSSACTAGTSPASRPQKRVDFLTRYCGLSLLTLFERIGTMAASGQPLPSPFHAPRRAHPWPGSAERIPAKRHRPSRRHRRLRFGASTTASGGDG